MSVTTTPRRVPPALRVVTSLFLSVVVAAGLMGGPASAATTPPAEYEWTDTRTVTSTVTVEEWVTLGVHVGYGKATATATATATRTVRKPTQWEAFYWASSDAYYAAEAEAKALADAQARPIALAAAQADAQAKADAAAAGVEYTATATRSETVTAEEWVTLGVHVGYGKATATATATATRTVRKPTQWEAYYWASYDAFYAAQAEAKASADAQARPIALAAAQADAQAKADAAAAGVEYTATATRTETVKVEEFVTLNGHVGYGTATATATATATRTVRKPTHWEAYYWASYDAFYAAQAEAKASADAQARPIARAAALADAQAKYDASLQGYSYSHEWTQTETVTVNESVTIGDFVGTGSATATATATATGTATKSTHWEAYYWAVINAHALARDEAQAIAAAEARPIALAQAEADAQAQYDAAQDVPDPDPEEPPPGPSCGPELLKADGTPWTCTFVDDFRGTALDTTKWSPVTTEESDFSYGDCFLGDGNNMTVASGVLSLTTRQEDEPVTCEHRDGPITTNVTSAAVTSLGTFSQTFGRFEIRAAMPQTAGPGLQSALWMVPDDPTYYGTWPGSGEIDIAEFYSQYPDRIIPAIHYNSLLSWATRTNNECYVYDPSSFHLYAVEWTPARITVKIDGQTCVDHLISPLAPLLGSAPFDRPYNINLTQMLGSGPNALAAGATFEDATLRIDYVRAWS
ncbi:glycosyl hydrolase family 16 [Aeromicrobium marinum DSM 15272]|uniref:Glycosyl hydrolase family 16 n=1 Tax=Aeromicrobium marinum DSM 15272 TaxID=585531 RepID=E2SFS2_9ACTN|nr:glycoside hydrolase family 16 protein [Aeromicrobium marinum]EFQ81974.1 glycosyl hydrolase family 16 [Aeromicrobium marinum DSM 15272]